MSLLSCRTCTLSMCAAVLKMMTSVPLQELFAKLTQGLQVPPGGSYVVPFWVVLGSIL